MRTGSAAGSRPGYNPGAETDKGRVTISIAMEKSWWWDWDRAAGPFNSPGP
jgi:hypothetical protein